MSTRLGAWAAALVLLLGGALAPAQERSQRIHVDVEDQPLGEVVAAIVSRTGVRALVDERVREVRVSLTLHDVSARQALATLAEFARVKLVERPGGLLLLTRPLQVRVQLSEADVRTAIRLLAGYAGKSVVIGAEVQGTVTLELKGVDWDRALRSVVQTAGDYALVEEEDLITVGRGRPGGDGPALELILGTLLERRDELLRIRLQGGQVVPVLLPPDAGPRRALLRALLELAPGSRVALGVRQGPDGARAEAAVLEAH